MGKLIIENFDAFRELEGKTLPEGEWISVTQEMINDFAKATGDFQWIHVDVEKAAKSSPFKKPVAHGFMSLALLSKMIGDLIHVKSSKMGVNYGLNRVRFPSPVLVDSRLKLVANIANIENYGDTGLKITWDCIVKVEGSKKPACVSEFISLMF
ncbi:MAG: MaoC family dehydratase [Flavobacteriales bacterium]|nr:MaoC family dehydratase [Flavobacteriales bacterium]